MRGGGGGGGGGGGRGGEREGEEGGEMVLLSCSDILLPQPDSRHGKFVTGLLLQPNQKHVLSDVLVNFIFAFQH